MVFAPPRVDQMDALLAAGVADFITFTAPFNYSGHPTITLPATFNRDGLPMSFQLIGRLLGEPTLIRAGHAYEHARGPLRSVQRVDTGRQTGPLVRAPTPRVQPNVTRP